MNAGERAWLYFKLSAASADWSAGTAWGGGGTGTVQSVNGVLPVGGDVALEAENIPTSLAGAFAGADVETVLDDHDGRIVDLEAEVSDISVNPTPLVGVNATADVTNRLSVKSPASLFDEEGGDHRLKINKALATDTASILFQTAYSGRAEFGLTGNDNWGVKVSADGVAWTSAFAVDAATGRVTLPPALPLSDPDQVVAYRHVREKLTANRTYFVLSDGNDSNNGLTDASGGAFLTPQKAFDTICTLDLGGFNATISIGAGAFEGITFNAPWVGGNIIVSGAGAGNTSLSTSSRSAAILTTAALSGLVTLNDFKIEASGSTRAGIRMDALGKIVVGSGMEFGSVTGSHMLLAAPGAFLHGNQNYTISGGARVHMDAQFLSFLRNDAKTVTLTGVPAFSFAFCAASNGGTMLASSLTFSGTATGKRYDITTGGGVNVAGGGTNYFPGNATGVATAPGWYA